MRGRDTASGVITPYGVALYMITSAVRILIFCTGRSIHFAELRFSKSHNIAHFFKNANKILLRLCSSEKILCQRVYQRLYCN